MPAARRAFSVLLAGGFVLFCCGSELRADEYSGSSAETLQVSGADPYASSLSDGGVDQAFEVPGGGIGFLTRAGHIAGETVGRDDSITHFGLAPYLFHEQSMLFGDLRLFRTNEGRTGGSAGLGLRHYMTELDAIFGVAGYYDNDDSRGTRFKQLGLSLEYLSRWYDIRANWYVPIEDTERILGTSIVNGSQRFDENLLLFDRRTDFGSAADGADVMLSVPVPGEVPEMFNWEVSAGGYHYQVRDTDITKMWGYKIRTDADLFKRILHMFVELTSDRVTDTNVVFGASLNYYHGFENGRRLHDSQFYRMSEWVRRNYTVVTINDSVITAGEVARNPETGDPYFFAHVRNIPGAPVPPPIPAAQPPFFNFPAPFGDGTVDMPFQFIQEAQVALQGSPPVVRDNGVIYVHGNSVFNGNNAVVALNDGEIVLGEGEGDGVIQSLPVAGFSTPLFLPIVIPDGSVPVLANATGDAVTAADDNLFAGFNITNPGNNGITINGSIDGMFRDVMITGAGGDGVFMTGASGLFSFDRVQVNNAAGVGFHVEGGTAMVTVADADNVALGGATITNSQNEALLIQNTAGGFVNLADTSIDDNGGAGIRLINNIGSVTLGLATLDDTVMSADPLSVGAGLEIRGASGNTSLLQNITITNPAGPGLLIADHTALGTVNTIANITVNSRNAIGADFDNVDGTVIFGPNSNLSIGTLAGAGAMDPAIRFHNGSSGSVTLNTFSIANSLSDGILIGDPTGAMINEAGAVFRTQGNGTINATTGAAVNIRGADGMREPTFVDFLGNLTSNTRVGRGIDIEDTSGPIRFSGSTTINNNAVAQSGLSALFIDDVTGSVGFGVFDANDNLGPEPAVDIQNVLAPAGVSFLDLNITNANANGTTGVEVDDTNQFTTADGEIEVLNGRAVDIENSNINVTLMSVDNTDSPDFGIRVIDSPGSFTIEGDGVILGSGGTISGAGTAGAFFDNTDEISLSFQDYTENAIGIQVDNLNDDELDFFFLNQSRIMSSVAQGVLTNDVRNITIQDSTFTSNGTGAVVGTQQHILINVLDNPNTGIPGMDDILFGDPDFESFVYVIQRNLFMDDPVIIGDDAVLVRTMGAAAADARVELSVLDNQFTPFDRIGLLTTPASAISVNWNGILAADILRNTINMGTGNRQTAINVRTQGFDTGTNININDNLITAGANTDTNNLTGINVDLVGPSNVTVARNAIDFMTDNSVLGSGNVGLRFRFIDGNNNLDIVDNLIVMDEGTGISIEGIASPLNARSSVFFSGNQIGQLLGRVPQLGISITNITGTLLLSGNNLNLVYFTNSPFLINGASQGQFNINGFPVP